MTPEHYLTLDYARIFIPDDGGYTAEILEFTGCIAAGNTLQEAWDNLERTALSWLAACLAHGHAIPEPSTYQGRHGLRTFAPEPTQPDA